MAQILAIETSTAVCSIALHRSGELIGLSESGHQGVHAERIMLMIEEVLQAVQLDFGDLDAVAVSEGPGSYTGLRIGVSTAKGISYAQNIPMIAVSPLLSLASQVNLKSGEWVVPMMDARRMEVYRIVVDSRGNQVEDLVPEIVDADSYSFYLENGKVFFVGDAVQKVRQVLVHANAVFLSKPAFSAAHYGYLAFQKYQKEEFVDTAYFVPNYLKEFKALQSKKNPLLSL
ncbi:MAG: tRNA (adenosine(37)-N6)-threonylcarbamoyltransferase complex dimerization subunit type 1 TsaB [Algoriphagus sp. 32-45-6]|nr:MAG: tRNA (adenosine(37)-N6)-threonylcarbamoyltransferase complex dimerization subunit type 1 TsaB [Algoriphagus sp. 32-45-6]